MRIVGKSRKKGLSHGLFVFISTTIRYVKKNRLKQSYSKLTAYNNKN